MELPKNLWIWGVLALGVVLILVALLQGGPTKKQKSISILARAEKLTGTAFLVKDGGRNREALTKKINLGHFDSIETGDLGEVRLDFESAFRIRVKENSLVTLERVEDQAGFHVVLVLKRGDLTVESPGREGELFIAKNGERISANDFQESPLSAESVADPEPIQKQEPVAASALTESEIQSVMGSHRTSFLKCYTQLLQKDPNARGEASIAFTVENSGRVSDINVTSNTLSQADFKRCLTDVMNRINFRPYSGSPISTLFPLQFE